MRKHYTTSSSNKATRYREWDDAVMNKTRQTVKLEKKKIKKRECNNEIMRQQANKKKQ